MQGLNQVRARDAQAILAHVRDIAARFAQERSERQRRRALVQADFDQLREAGLLLVGVPVDQGGIWESVEPRHDLSCEILRTLAHGDPAVALMSAMHPAVLVSVGWLTLPRSPFTLPRGMG